MLFNIENLQRRKNPLAGISTKADLAALEMFKAGAILKKWRVASPANWWLETLEGQSVELPKDAQAQAWGYSRNVELRLMELGRRHEVSQERVLRMNLAGGLYHGAPQLETWAFDAERVAVLERQWLEVQEGLRQREVTTPITALRRVQELSAPALALLRLLKKSPRVYPYKELCGPLQELETGGWVRMRSDLLQFEAVRALQTQSLPRGACAKLNFVGTYQSRQVPD